MAKPTRLGIILDGADAVEFWKNEEEVTFTDEQMEFCDFLPTLKDGASCFDEPTLTLDIGQSRRSILHRLILSQLVRSESNHDRGTIHPQPEVWGFLYPCTPTR